MRRYIPISQSMFTCRPKMKISAEAYVDASMCICMARVQQQQGDMKSTRTPWKAWVSTEANPLLASSTTGTRSC